MSEDMDFCEWYISKCQLPRVGQITIQTFRTPADILSAYRNSACYRRDKNLRNKYLIEQVSEFMRKDDIRNKKLDEDAYRVWRRACDLISHESSYDDIFRSLLDYSWVKASALRAENESSIVKLVRREGAERDIISQWLGIVYREIQNAKYDLQCMKEADNLPFRKRLFLGLLDNQDVAWYANAQNFSYDELKRQIKGCENYIRSREIIYFAFLAVSIYREDLRRRYL